MANPFSEANEGKVELSKSAQRQIRELYKKASKEIRHRMETVPDNGNVSSSIRKAYYEQHLKELDKVIEKLDKDVEDTVKNAARRSAKLPVTATQDFLGSLNIGINGLSGAFSSVPEDVVNNLVTGKLYSGRWSLSESIWVGNKQVKKGLSEIIAQGLAENRSTYDIAKDLEKYVNPNAKKDWNWSKVYPGVNKVVDYNAQRLARTMIQHAYQSSLTQTVADNPFIEKIRWNSANSHRVCDICKERDGKLYPKHALPLDHPNGMCFFTVEIEDSMTDISNRIADWANGKDDKGMDKFAKSMFPDEDLSKTKAKVKPKVKPKTKIEDKSKTKTKIEDKPKTRTKPKTETKPRAKSKAETEPITNIKELRNELKPLMKHMKGVLNKDQIDLFLKTVASRPRDVQDKIFKYQKALKALIQIDDASYYNYVGRYIAINTNESDKTVIATFFHEFGHCLDNSIHATNEWYSVSKEGKKLKEILRTDCENLIVSSKSLKRSVKLDFAEYDLETKGIQDIISGSTRNSIRVKWGHSTEYWDSDKDNVTMEAVANMFQAYMVDGKTEELMTKYFPNAYKHFTDTFINGKNIVQEIT